VQDTISNHRTGAQELLEFQASPLQVQDTISNHRTGAQELLEFQASPLQVQDTISNHRTGAQELLEFQASPDQFTCNTISVSCNQPLKLCSVVLDLHSEHLP
jgi:hypothetical protein